MQKATACVWSLKNNNEDFRLKSWPECLKAACLGDMEAHGFLLDYKIFSCWLSFLSLSLKHTH